MTLPLLFLIAGIAMGIRLFPIAKVRKWLLLAANVVLIYWLQPELPIRYLDFYLPTFMVAIILIGWYFLSSSQTRLNTENKLAIGIVLGTMVVINLTRYLGLTGVITPSRPPNPVFFGVIVTTLIVAAFLFRKIDWNNPTLWGVAFALIITALVVLKNPDLRLLSSQLLRRVQGQNSSFATRIDIQWLGFSYVVFRLIHTIKDFQTKRISDVSLATYVNYVLFFPAFNAGPIDRIQHFQDEFSLEQPLKIDQLGKSSWRLVLGVFKKFAIADTLAVLAINPDILANVKTTGFVWLSFYAYAFLILFDFSGYTDIAIGLGLLLGLKLPENFQSPYLKPNLKLFWDNWHMTLTQWFRAYYFNPVSRKIRRKWKKMPVSIMVFIMQVTTMVLIGLWHGVTWNFVIWGLWHGLGMFVFNRWNEWFSPRREKISSGFIQKAIPVAGVFMTFHFVAFGWVWFALPEFNQSINVFARLFGG